MLQEVAWYQKVVSRVVLRLLLLRLPHLLLSCNLVGLSMAPQPQLLLLHAAATTTATGNSCMLTWQAGPHHSSRR
jgi:hypothetical protein